MSDDRRRAWGNKYQIQLTSFTFNLVIFFIPYCEQFLFIILQIVYRHLIYELFLFLISIESETKLIHDSAISRNSLLAFPDNSVET